MPEQAPEQAPEQRPEAAAAEPVAAEPVAAEPVAAEPVAADHEPGPDGWPGAAPDSRVEELFLTEPSDDEGEVTSDGRPVPTSVESRLRAQARLRQGTTTLLVQQQGAAIASMKRNLGITTVARAIFYLVAAWLLLVVSYFIAVRFDEFVSVALDARGNPDTTYLWQTLLAICTPVVIGLVATAVCVGCALVVQNRGNGELQRSLDYIGRLAREGSASQNRSRALTQILEETLANARQAFTLQLWISRVLFAVGIVLIFTFIASLFFDNTLFTGGAVLSAVLSFAAAALLNPQRQIGSDLANVTQLEAILGGYTRQAALIEEYVYDVIAEFRDRQKTDHASETVWEGVDRLSDVLRSAVRSIDEHVQSDEPISAREQWLMEKLVGDSSEGLTRPV
jgi:hypothetical protein